MVKHNLKIHEMMGLILLFIGSTWLGIGIYATTLASNKILMDYFPPLTGFELLIFPIFYGLGVVLLALGAIELREALPGKGRR